MILTIYYWTGELEKKYQPILKLKHNKKIERVSKKKFNDIVDKILKQGLNVGLVHGREGLIVYIDNRVFTQR